MGLFGFLVLSMIIGSGLGYLCLRGAFNLGQGDFSYNCVTLFTWLELGVYEAITAGVIFVNIFLSNSLIDYLFGWLSLHLISDALFSFLAAQLLIFAMIIEGVRRRRHYYSLTVPWRRSYRRFSKRQLIRPPFWSLYRLW